MSLNLPESAEAVLGLRLYRGLKVRRLTRRVLRFFYLRFAREDLRCSRLQRSNKDQMRRSTSDTNE